MKQIIAPIKKIKYWDPIAQYQSRQHYKSDARNDKYDKRPNKPQEIYNRWNDRHGENDAQGLIEENRI